MRITNQMISNNSLRNMQKTMANVDNRTTQMETGKKITKASEDPVVAVRALKLRTMVTQLEQYKDKNIGDAESWLKITTTSLDNITSRHLSVDEGHPHLRPRQLAPRALECAPFRLWREPFLRVLSGRHPPLLREEIRVPLRFQHGDNREDDRAPRHPSEDKRH